MKLTCDEATKICDKSQYKEASIVEKIKLNIHLLLCKKCGLYAKQNSLLTKCYKKHKQFSDGHKRCLCEEEKKTMEKELKQKLQ